MIDTLNEEISKFLSSFLNTEDEKLSLIEKKCSSTKIDTARLSLAVIKLIYLAPTGRSCPFLRALSHIFW